MDSWPNVIAKVVGAVVLSISALAGISLLMAFPVKWCWNFTVPELFHGPVITWGHAWCLTFLSGMFIKSNMASAK